MAGQPYKPSDVERQQYYCGLAGSPELIARTSTDRWSVPRYSVGTWDGLYKKHLAGITQPDLISKWSKTLCYRLIETLQDCPWIYFFPIRVGLDVPKNPYATTLPRLVNISTILMIAVEKDSLEWERAISFALDCRKILGEHNIEDIEVEIREGSFEQQAACIELETEVDNTEACFEKTNDQILPMLSYSGCPITYLENRAGQGTIGLYVKFENSDKVYGMTCRHVVRNKRLAHENYIYSGGKRQYHVQADQGTFDDLHYAMQCHQEDLEQATRGYQEKQERWDTWYQHQDGLEYLKPTSTDTKTLRQMQIQLDYHRKIFDLVKPLKKRTSRIIGHLAFHSSHQLSFRQKGYLKDWALIEMDPNKFIKGPETKVFVGNRFKEFATKHKLPERSSYNENVKDGVLTLRLEDQKRASQDPFYVCKQGATSGLTFGEKSGIEAVVRQRQGNGSSYTWELLIIPEPGGGAFSKAGDSGSCVFDLHGNVIGLLVGSNYNASGDGNWERGVSPEYDGPRQVKIHSDKNIGPPEAPTTEANAIKPWPNNADVTFVSPIDWVLDDVEDLTGQRPRLA